MNQWTLVRHGESSANAANQLSGWQDVSLTHLGMRQAKKSGRALIGADWDIVLSSDLKRASQTAQIALEEWSRITQKPTPKVYKDSRFRERCFGTLQGQCKTKLKSQGKMTHLKRWSFDDGGVESNRSLWMRLLEGLKDYRSQKVLLFAHGGVIRLMLGWHNQHSLEQSYTAKITNGSVHAIAINRKPSLNDWKEEKEIGAKR